MSKLASHVCIVLLLLSLDLDLPEIKSGTESHTEPTYRQLLSSSNLHYLTSLRKSFYEVLLS